MKEFKVGLEWWGWVPNFPWYYYISGIYKIEREKFVDSYYVFDLIVTPSKVKIAGPGTELNTNPSLLIKSISSNIAIPSSDYDRYDVKTEGWLVYALMCNEEESNGDSNGANSGGALNESEKMNGVNVRFKAIIDSGVISTNVAAITTEISVRGQKIKIPIGASTTKTSGGKNYTVTGTFKLCPDGIGDYTVDHSNESRQDGEIIGVHEIKAYWKHKNH